jgi:hypothetical protein
VNHDDKDLARPVAVALGCDLPKRFHLAFGKVQRERSTHTQVIERVGLQVQSGRERDGFGCRGLWGRLDDWNVRPRDSSVCDVAHVEQVGRRFVRLGVGSARRSDAAQVGRVVFTQSAVDGEQH